MEASRIDLKDWEYYGEGGSSTSYIYKLDGNIVLKLNNNAVPVENTVREYLSS